MVSPSGNDFFKLKNINIGEDYYIKVSLSSFSGSFHGTKYRFIFSVLPFALPNCIEFFT